jgi:hypothetical protein
VQSPVEREGATAREGERESERESFIATYLMCNYLGEPSIGVRDILMFSMLINLLLFLLRVHVCVFVCCVCVCA